MAKSEEELKSLLMKVKEVSENIGLKFNIQKTKITASSAITSWQIDGKQWKQQETLVLGLQNHCNGTLLQYPCLENPMERGAWQATVHGVAKSRTRLSNFISLSLQSPSALIFEPPKIKSLAVSTVSRLFAMK